MVLNARRSLGLLFLLPIAAALPNPTPAPDFNLGSLNLHYRGLLDPPVDTTSSRSSAQVPATTPTPSVVPPPADTTSTTTTTSTTSTTSSTTRPTTAPTTSAPSSVTSQTVRTADDGQVITSFIIVPAQSSTSAAPAPSADTGSPGPGTGTFIGLGVAGGIAVLGLVGFIIWKMTQKRFQQFDDDAGDIKWPAPKEAELQAPAAPSMMAATNATNSSIDLTKDPYAVPPLPQQRTLPYYDDPSGSAYYDPYRGPVPNTFTSPPGSTEGHPYPGGEVIPMNTYPSNSGRQSPGPNAAYNAAYNDPYARSRSPGPMAAYATTDPYARSQSPATTSMAYEDPYAGRRSPGPSLAYGGGGAYDPMAPPRIGTPVGGPGRVGTPVGTAGYGSGGGGAVPPPIDVLRTGTPQGGYRGPSPAPYGAPQQQQHQAMQDPYGRYTPNPYGQ